MLLITSMFPSARVVGQGYTPEHPVVKEMVERAVVFLEGGGGRNSQYVSGGDMLSALAIYKVRLDPTHKEVQRGCNVALGIAKGIENSNPMVLNEKVLYEASVAAMLLGTVDVDRYRGDCVRIRDFLLKVQRPYGGFGYVSGAHLNTGDTSQTQYAVLALWTLDQLGVVVQTEPMERAIRWLQNTQDPTGGWGYQGKIGSSLKEPQEGVTHSLSAAGLCSILIAGDFLGFYRNRLAEAEEEDVPRCFRRVQDPKDKDARKQTSMDAETTQANVLAGVKWHADRPYSRELHSYQWYYYYRYSEERMEAFIEIAKGKQVTSPAWYNKGVEELRKFQDGATGGFGMEQPEQTPPQVCTSFAVLYLIRSTQKAIGKIKDGVARGAIGLPDDVSQVEVSEGRILDRTKMDSIEEVLKTLEAEGGGADQKDIVVSEKLKLEKDPRKRKDQLNRLARLMKSPNVQARRSAAKLLGRGDDLAFVPVLIYGLTDGDRDAAKNSEDSLRILSRRLKTRYLPDLGGTDRQYTAAEAKFAEEKWIEWYRTVRPDYVFIAP